MSRVHPSWNRIDGWSGNMELSDLEMTSIIDLGRLIELVSSIDPAQLKALASMIASVQFALQKYQPPHETKPNPSREQQDDDI